MKNKGIKYLIIDDEPLAHQVIKQYAGDIDDLLLVGQAYKPSEALKLIQELQPDLIFLDIRMPKMTGLQLLDCLDKAPVVIITTAYSEYAVQSYEYAICDYLLKPFRYERMLQAIHKARILIQGNTTVNNQKSIFIRVDRRIVQINTDEIEYIQAYGNYVKIWRGKDYLMTHSTLTQMEALLQTDAFYKIHKSYLIHKIAIDYIEGNEVKMKNGDLLPISKHQLVRFWNG